jgi:TetR/AcrR family transcriptional regulator
MERNSPVSSGERNAPAPNSVRVRRDRADIREALLRSALVEFGAKGYDGASTRVIAENIDAHQPQINYHFESKAVLWTTAVDYLFGLFAKEMDGVLQDDTAEIDDMQVAAALADAIRRFVRFAAAHPELNQIMVHEGTAASDRLTWMTETHVKPFFDALEPGWTRLVSSGIAAPIDQGILYYILVGAASLPYVNAPEVRLLTGRDPHGPEWIQAHADALVSILLPGLAIRSVRGKRGSTSIDGTPR